MYKWFSDGKMAIFSFVCKTAWIGPFWWRCRLTANRQWCLISRLIRWWFLCPPPPFQKRESIMLCCCLLVSRSTNSYRSFSKQRLHLQKWNLAYRFIIRSSSVWGMIEKILTDVWPLDLEKWQLFAVSVYFLHRGLREGGTSVLQTSRLWRFLYDTS